MYKFYIYIHTYFLFLSLYIIHVYIFISYKIILNLFNLLIFSSIDTIRTLTKLNKILVKKTSDVSLTHETFFSVIESRISWNVILLEPSNSRVHGIMHIRIRHLGGMVARARRDEPTQKLLELLTPVSLGSSIQQRTLDCFFHLLTPF